VAWQGLAYHGALEADCMSTSPEFARIVESIRSCDFRRYNPNLVSSLARRGRIGDVDKRAAMATFVRVVDAGSMSGAARSLPSSLTSVSRQISALEQRFGTQLLLRTTRHLALTDDGRMFYERAKSILGELKEVEAALSRGRHWPSERIRVSAPTLIGRLLIAP